MATGCVAEGEGKQQVVDVHSMHVVDVHNCEKVGHPPFVGGRLRLEVKRENTQRRRWWIPYKK